MSTSAVISMLKMSGSGNLFMVMDNRRRFVKNSLSGFAKSVCQAQQTDGLLMVEEAEAPQDYDFRMHYFNSDGSEAGMCGNGARCIAYYAASELKMANRGLRFEVAGSAEPIRSEVDLHKGLVTIEMSGIYGYLSGALDPEVLKPLQVSGPISFIQSGVPHVVIWVDDVDRVDVPGLGAKVRNHTSFHDTGGTNVNFVNRIGPGRLKIRTYERGVERETGACGTGTIGACVVSAKQGLDAPNAETQQYHFQVEVPSQELLEVAFFMGSHGEVPSAALTGSVKVLGRREWAQ
jgi:diaminopimelate epimerase